MFSLQIRSAFSSFRLCSPYFYKIYFTALWLELADLMPPGQFFPDAYAPAPDEDVWVASLEIGTPNLLTLKGRAKELALVATFLTSVLTVPVVGTEALKNYTEAVKNYAEAEEASAEAGVHIIDIVEKAVKLYEKGKISEDALRHKLKLPDELVHSIIATQSIVPPQLIAIAPAAGAVR